MNLNIKHKTRNTQKILTFLNEGYKSPDNYIGSDMPYFMKNENTKFKIGHHIIPKLPNGLNHNINIMYKLIGNPNIEIYIRDWTFMSLNKALEIAPVDGGGTNEAQRI